MHTSFFRATGLNIINYVLGRVGHRSFKEPPKTILRRSWSLVFVRNIVHVIPLAGAAVVCYLNLAGYYLGSSFENVAALQFAAKLHEIFMVASLGQIVLYTVRNELVSEGGLPFGALVSGLSISQLSYLWSIEFWASITASKFPWVRRVRLFVIVVICILLAATVGPSSAIAMIPRLGNWPAGRTHIWFNGTQSQLFPTNISADDIDTACINSSMVPISDGCPSAGWQDIAVLAPFFRYDFGPSASNWPNVDVLFFSALGLPSSIQLAGKDSLRSLYLCTPLGNQCVDSVATTQHAAVANALETLGVLWIDAVHRFEGNPGRISDYITVVHTTETLQPFVAVNCEGVRGLIGGPDDELPISFAAGLPNSTWNRPGGYEAQVNITSPSRLDILNTPGDPSVPRVVFVDLPSSTFNDTTLGAIILDPTSPENYSQPFTTCLIGAGWGQSNMNATEHRSFQALDKSVASTGFQDAYEEDITVPYFFTDFPLQPVYLSKAWADFTNPFLPGFDETIFSAVSTLITNSHEFNTMEGLTPEDSVDRIREILLASLIANGLSNTASNFTLQGNITRPFYLGDTFLNGESWILHNQDFFTVDPQESANWEKLQVKSFVTGLSYNSDGPLIRIALGILLTYCLVTTVFIAYTSMKGISSSSWDSMSELAALAMNSPPAKELYNTCAGVASLNTYKTLIRVAVTENDSQSEKTAAKHASLIFGSGNVESGSTKVKLNEKYG